MADLASAFASTIFEKEMNLRKAFSKMDRDQSGFLDYDEFSAAMKQMGYADDPAAVRDVFSIFDQHKTGKIDMQEFQNTLMEYGGNAPPPTSMKKKKKKQQQQPLAAKGLSSALSRGGGGGGGGGVGGGGANNNNKQPRHIEAIERAKTLDTTESDMLTDAEVMVELSDRLIAEGPPLHTLFKLLAGPSGKMDVKKLREVVEKMDLGETLASAQEDAEAPAQSHLNDPRVGSPEGAFTPAFPDGIVNNAIALHRGVGHDQERQEGVSNAQRQGVAALASGDTSDRAMRSLLPLLKGKIREHGYDHIGDLFLKFDIDRSGKIAPAEFFKLMHNWGVQLSPEQTLHLLEPFDIDVNGEIDFGEFVKWLEMWEPSEGEDGALATWVKGGDLDRRVWAASGKHHGRLGRLGRLFQMLDVNKDRAVESWEFIRGLSKGDDYDRPVFGSGGGGQSALGDGRLNADGSRKRRASVPGRKKVGVGPRAFDDTIELLLHRITSRLSWLADGDGELAFADRLAAEAVDGMLNAEGLKAALTAIGVQTAGADELVEKYGVDVNGEKMVHVSKLTELLPNLDKHAVNERTEKPAHTQRSRRSLELEEAHAAAAAAKEAAAREEEQRQKAANADKKAADAERRLAETQRQLDEAQQAREAAELRANTAANAQRQQQQQQPPPKRPAPEPTVKVDPELAELAELAAAAKADRARPAVASMTPTELRMVMLNDNSMIQQMRGELAERSKKLKDMFRRMDTNGDGTISLVEFRKGLQRSGFTDHGNMHMKGLDRDMLTVSVEDTVRLFNYFDQDGDGHLSYAEFMRLLQNSTKVDYTPLVVKEDRHTTVSS